MHLLNVARRKGRRPGICLVPRPHPLRGEGSGEERQDPWFMTSFCNVIMKV